MLDQASTAGHTRAADRLLNPLTGGLNVLEFRDNLYAELNRDGARPIYVLCVELSTVSDIMVIGERSAPIRLVGEAGRLLTQAVEPRDYLAYAGQWRFYVAVHADSYEELDRRGDTIRQSLSGVGRQFGLGATMQVSPGACVGDATRNDADLLLSCSIDAAAQPDARFRLHLLTDKEESNLLRTLDLLRDFDSAMERGDFSFVVQPKVRLDNGRCDAAEALVRWNHPTYGRISPDAFINALESQGRIYELDLYVYRSVCRQMAEWRQKGLPLPVMSFNFSRAGMLDLSRDLVGDLTSIASLYDMDPELLELEVTESVSFDMFQSEYLEKRLARLRRNGFRIAFDDFGTGFSLLGMLNHILFNTVKLDKSLMEFDDENRFRTLVNPVVRMSHELGIDVVAEGVEVRHQVEVLRQLGCDYIQGYVFSRPLDPNIFAETYMDTSSCVLAR